VSAASRGHWLVGVMLLLAGCGSESVRGPRAELLASGGPSRALVPEATGTPSTAARRDFRFFVAGHSLVDRPLPDFLAAAAKVRSPDVSWERRYVVGASIRQLGPPALPGAPFDVLLITENHSLLGTLAWNGTPATLREWHEAHVVGNPGGRTVFYVPWLSRNDLDDPTGWIGYETSAIHVWRCLVARVNADLARSGRADRIELLPASLALADLVRHLRDGGAVPGLPGATPRERYDAIFSDDVHLTATGAYYLSAYVAAALGIASEDAMAAAVTPPVPAEAAASLARHAATFLASRAAASDPVMSAGSCRDYIAESFAADYWAYNYRIMRRDGTGWSRAAWRTMKGRVQTGRILRDATHGPFRDGGELATAP
jgi:hypothetical protein